MYLEVDVTLYYVLQIMKLLILLGLFAAANAISFMDVSKEEWTNFKVSRILFIFFLLLTT